MTFFPALSITTSQMTTINDKIIKDKETFISAISEADEAAMSEWLIYYDIKFLCSIIGVIRMQI